MFTIMVWALFAILIFVVAIWFAFPSYRARVEFPKYRFQQIEKELDATLESRIDQNSVKKCKS